MQQLGIKFSREWAMPSKETFTIKPILSFVLRYLARSKVSIDPFARNTRLCDYRNDLNPNSLAEWHLEAADFLQDLVNRKVVAGCVLFDPPYSLEQLKRSYESIGRKYTLEDGWNPGRWSKEKDLCAKLIRSNGTFLSFGWNSCGVGEKRGFAVEEILLVNHGPGHNDTICMAERKLNSLDFVIP